MTYRVIGALTSLFIFASILSFPVLASNLSDTYNKMQLQGKLDFSVFKKATKGFDKINRDSESSIFSIIDYSQVSTKKRLFVLDMKNKRLLFNTLIAHGTNSGSSYATSFSNINNSRKSSLGFYKAAETYYGKHGYSLRLDGLEPGFNDNARKRAIVIHGAWYVSDNFIKQHGRLGRSWGCPALPQELSRDVIDFIKGGSYVFIYANDKGYQNRSKILN